MRDPNFATQGRIINITSTTDAQTIDKLIRDRLATLSKSYPTDHNDNVLPILQIFITPSADIELRDVYYGDEMTVYADERHAIPVEDAPTKYSVKNAATINVELFFGS